MQSTPVHPSAELTLRMLGDNITFNASQWEALADELQVGSILRDRIMEMLGKAVVVRTADGFAATEDWDNHKDDSRLFNYYDQKIGNIMWQTVDSAGWFTFIHEDSTIQHLNGDRICTMAHARRKGWVK